MNHRLPKCCTFDSTNDLPNQTVQQCGDVRPTSRVLRNFWLESHSDYIKRQTRPIADLHSAHIKCQTRPIADISHARINLTQKFTPLEIEKVYESEKFDR